MKWKMTDDFCVARHFAGKNAELDHQYRRRVTSIWSPGTPADPGLRRSRILSQLSLNRLPLARMSQTFFVVGKVREITGRGDGLGHRYFTHINLAPRFLDFTADVKDAVAGLHRDGQVGVILGNIRIMDFIFQPHR